VGDKNGSKLDDQLVWDVKTTAGKLGVSTAHVYDLIGRGKLPSIRLGRIIRVPVKAITELLDEPIPESDNYSCAGPAVQEKSTCHISASEREVRASSGGYRSPMQTVNELESLLEQRKRGKL